MNNELKMSAPCDRNSLRLACSESLGSALEVVDDGLDQWVAVLYNNGGIEPLPLDDGAGSADSEAPRLGMPCEPCEEQAITVGFTPVAVVAHVEQHVKPFGKELVDDSENSLFNLRVVGRPHVFHFLDDELVSLAPANRMVVVEGYQIVYTERCSENKVTIGRKPHLIVGPAVDTVDGKLYHSVTTFPVRPISRHSSAMRRSALCFTSNACLKRASASSYVTFFVAMIITYCWFPAAKVSNNSETEKENSEILEFLTEMKWEVRFGK